MRYWFNLTSSWADCAATWRGCCTELLARGPGEHAFSLFAGTLGVDDAGFEPATSASFIQRYPGQRLGLRIIQAKVQQGHLYVLHQDLAYGPISVASDGGDEFLGRVRAVGCLEVGEGKVGRAWRFFQVAARAQSGPQPVERPSVVRLDERRAGEGVEVREPYGKGWYVRQRDPGALRDLLQPLAGDLILFPWFVYGEAEKYQRNVHEVVGV